jgi:uncharacterized protein YhaN
MGAIMAEMSKTAKSSMVREVKKTKVETPEESLRQLRLDLAAGLYVPTHRIKVLLDAYDASLKAYEELDGRYDALDGTLGRANLDFNELKETNENLESIIVHLQDDKHAVEKRIAALTAAVGPEPTQDQLPVYDVLTKETTFRKDDVSRTEFADA